MNESTTFHPNWTSPPGETISDILIEKSLSIKLFSKRLNESTEYINGLLKGLEEITPEIAQKLTITIGGSIDFWLAREQHYRSDLERLLKLDKKLWLKELPIRDMISFGWIDGNEDKVSECLKFFNVQNINDWRDKYSNSISNIYFRKSSTFKSDYGALISWLRQGEILGEKLNCKKWNANQFEKTLENIKPLTRKKRPQDFLPALTNACADCGVALVIVPTPKGCRASGATKFVSSNRALMQLSFRYYSDDQFWFTFFHEAGHLLLHHSNDTIIEGFTEGMDFEMEKEANLFAGEILIPYNLKQEFSKIRGNKRDIINFAMLAGISPGIVVGQLQFHGFIDKKYLNSYKRRYSWEDIY